MDKNAWSLQPEVVGWRIWKVDEDELVSPVFGYIRWPHDEPLKAVCDKVKPADQWHAPPGHHCECGIWATRYMPPSVFPEFQPLVLGLVRLWGEIAVHGNEGWRAQFARPIAIVNRWDRSEVIPDHLIPTEKQLAKVASAYRIPCLNLDDSHWVAAAKELGAPSTRWLGPIFHSYQVTEGWDRGLPAKLVICGCGYARAYPVNLATIGTPYEERPWTLDWIKHWASLEDQ